MYVGDIPIIEAPDLIEFDAETFAWLNPEASSYLSPFEGQRMLLLSVVV